MCVCVCVCEARGKGKMDIEKPTKSNFGNTKP